MRSVEHHITQLPSPSQGDATVPIERVAQRVLSRRRATVSTQQKSVAIMVLACERMNVAHDGPVRFGVGSIPALRSTFHTVEAAIR